MILDAHNEFSSAQAVTSTAISANVLDLGTTSVDLGGTGEQVYLIVQTQTACTDTSSDATLVVSLESAANEALSSSPVVHYTTAALAFAAFSPAKTVLVAIALPLGTNAIMYKRYLGIRYTVASGPLTAGAFDAFLTRDPQLWRAYANGAIV